MVSKGAGETISILQAGHGGERNDFSTSQPSPRTNKSESLLREEGKRGRGATGDLSTSSGVTANAGSPLLTAWDAHAMRV